MSYRYIIYEKMKELKNRVARITLNQPEKLNALSGALMNEFGMALEEAIRDPKVRVVIIRGAGRSHRNIRGYATHEGSGQSLA